MNDERPRLDVRGYIRAVCTAAGKRLTVADRGVLMAVGMFANAHTGETFANASTIGKVAGMNARNTRTHLTRLVAAGHLVSTPRPGRSTVLRLPASPAEVIHTPVGTDRGNTRSPRSVPTPTPVGTDLPPRSVPTYVNSQGTVRETLPTVHVANGFTVGDDELGEFEVSADIYARIGHRLGPNAMPRRAAR